MPLIEAAGTSVAKARQREEFDAAGTDLAQHVGVGTELVVRKNLQIDPAIGLGLDCRRHLLGADVHGMGIGKIVGIFVGEFGGLRPRDIRRAEAALKRRGRRSLENRAS